MKPEAAFELIDKSFFSSQAVVVSIDPRRVYVNDPDDVPYKVIKVTNPGIPVFSPFLSLPCDGLNEHC